MAAAGAHAATAAPGGAIRRRFGRPSLPVVPGDDCADPASIHLGGWRSHRRGGRTSAAALAVVGAVRFGGSSRAGRPRGRSP